MGIFKKNNVQAGREAVLANILTFSQEELDELYEMLGTSFEEAEAAAEVKKGGRIKRVKKWINEAAAITKRKILGAAKEVRNKIETKIVFYRFVYGITRSRLLRARLIVSFAWMDAKEEILQEIFSFCRLIHVL
jgi:VIT1/CCC1 family predicted Fe2+/Mn2+ transporter